MIKQVIEVVKIAALEIMKIYESEVFDIKNKEDDSPVTKADLIANSIIVEGLKSISSYPIVTEESYVEYEIRREWDIFWLIDPLDGTKDFIVKNGEFTINIALIKKNKPILGVVYIPFNKDVYYAYFGEGAYKNGNKIFNNSKRIDLIGTDSNFHSSKLTEDFFLNYKIEKVQRYGSSLKICKLAEGELDVYPRLNGTKEWDTAASHIIANEAGCKLIDVETEDELLYNKENIKNNFFIASRNDLEFKV